MPETAPKPWWKAAHKSGKAEWEAAIGTVHTCPYCRHPQQSHETNREPGTGEITIRCHSCGPFGVHKRTCIVLPKPGQPATFNAVV